MVNATGIVSDIVSLEVIQNSISLLLKIVGGLVGLYVIYMIITFITDRVKNKRLKKTYQNTNKILERLDKIEAKLDRKRKAK